MGRNLGVIKAALPKKAALALAAKRLAGKRRLG